MKLFKDRYQAGELLAQKLVDMNLGREICVLALPRGGVPLAREISDRLSCPLDLIFIKKIGAPGQPEFAIGAVSEDTAIHWQNETIDSLKISPSKLQSLAAEKKMELQAQIKKWRKATSRIYLKDKTVIVVDDGLATGSTMVAALQFLQKQSPRRVIVAVPVASESAKDAIKRWCDEAVILETPTPFFGVGQWYEDFTQVTDEEVRRLLNANLDRTQEGFYEEQMDRHR